MTSTVKVTANYTARCPLCGVETSLNETQYAEQSPAPCSTTEVPHAWVWENRELIAVPILLY